MRKPRIAKLLSLLLCLTLLAGLVAGCTSSGEPVGDAGEGAGSSDGSEAPVEPTPQAEGTATVDDSRYGGVLKVSWPTMRDTWDPSYSTGLPAYKWNMNVYENILARDSAGNYMPLVCDFEFAEDGMWLKLWVREGVTFHDGTPVTLEDVMASLERGGSFHASTRTYFTEKIDRTEVEGDTVTYYFTDYDVRTMYYLSAYQPFSAIMPKEICERYAEDPITEVEDVIGTGPYMLVDGELGQWCRMDRYDGYLTYESDAAGYGAPRRAYMDSIYLYVNADSTSSTMALMNGDYDISQEVPADYVELVRAEGLDIVSYPGTYALWLYFNTYGDRLVNDANLRKAIAAAMDYEEVIGELSGGFINMDLNPAQDGAYATSAFDNADYAGGSNFDLAREYLEASDYNGETLTILCESNYGESNVILLQSYLAEIGINLEIVFMDNNSIQEFYEDPDNDYDMIFLLGVKADQPALLSANVRTTFWNNPRKDELFDEMAGVVAGSAESLAMWEELAAIWVEDCNSVCLGEQTEVFYVTGGLNLNYSGNVTYFWNAYWDDPAAHME